MFGDRIDGTYLSIDSTHAHVNMPSALMWARGLQDRPISVRFEPSARRDMAGRHAALSRADERTFTAPNLQYLMDSPSEFGGFRTADVHRARRPARSRRSAWRSHHDGDDGGARRVRARRRENRARRARCLRRVRPAYDAAPTPSSPTTCRGPTATAWSIATARSSRRRAPIRANRAELLDTIAHEFFHSWNVERIRPQSLEPFNFDEANMSGELWLAEGFTQLLRSADAAARRA